MNGTQSTGNGRTFGAPETYGILTTAWDDVSRPSLLGRLQLIIPISRRFSRTNFPDMRLRTLLRAAPKNHWAGF